MRNEKAEFSSSRFTGMAAFSYVRNRSRVILGDDSRRKSLREYQGVAGSIKLNASQGLLSPKQSKLQAL